MPGNNSCRVIAMCPRSGPLVGRLQRRRAHGGPAVDRIIEMEEACAATAPADDGEKVRSATGPGDSDAQWSALVQLRLDLRQSCGSTCPVIQMSDRRQCPIKKSVDIATAAGSRPAAVVESRLLARDVALRPDTGRVV